MGTLTIGLAEHELKPLVDAWRNANLHRVWFWQEAEDAALTAVTTKPPVQLHNLTFSVEPGILFIGVPSGRRLVYVKPDPGENRSGGISITYWA